MADPSTPEPLVGDRLTELLALLDEVDSVELKVTVPESGRRSAVAALDMDPLDAEIRQVWFLDTPDLALERAGVVTRVRRVQGRGDDSVVKLRPVAPSDLPAGLRASPALVVEVDVLPGGHVCSATLRHRHDGSRVREALAGATPMHKLFTKEQRAFFAEHAPEGLGIDELVPLGPVTVLKLKFSPAGYEHRLVAELWLYPDGSRVLELSTKCAPADALAVGLGTKAYLEGKGIHVGGAQQTKTRTALELFSRELQG